MILSESDAEIVEPVIPSLVREASALYGSLREKGNLPVLLVEGPDGSGKEALISRSLAGRMRRTRGKVAVPVVVRLQAHAGDSPGSLSNRLMEAILNQHPDLRSRRGLPRESLLRLAERDPVAAGVRLARLFGQGSSSGTAGARMICIVSGIDRIYADHHFVCQGKPVIPVLGSTSDPLGFVREMAESGAVLFALCHREWAGPYLAEALVKSGLDRERLPHRTLSYPPAGEMEEVVRQAVKKFLPRCANDELITGLASDLAESPECLPVLPQLLATLNDEAERAGRRPSSMDYKTIGGLSGYLCRLGEFVYRYYNRDVTAQALWEELFREASKEDGYSLPAARLAEDRESWILAHQLVDWKILRIEGDSLETASFHPMHPALFTRWKRAQEWLEDEKPSLVVIRRFDEGAMDWEVSNRSRDRLLRDRDRLSTARLLLRTERLSRYLSPLTFDFLRESLKQQRNRLVVRSAGQVAALAAVLAIPVVFFGGKKNEGEQDTAVGQPVVEVQPKDPGEPKKEELVVRAASMVPLPPMLTEPEPEADPEPEPQPRRVTFPRHPELAEDSLDGLVERLEGDDRENAIPILLEIFRRPAAETGEGEKPSELRNLAMSLGSLAGVQEDGEAFQEAWKLGFSPLASGDTQNGWPPRMRLLMARIAWNEGKNDEALLFLSDRPDSLEIEEPDLRLVEILLGWYFDDRESAARDFESFDAESIRESGISRELLPRKIQKLVAVP